MRIASSTKRLWLLATTCLVIAAGSEVAFAQECFPPCRDGFECRAGQCVEPQVASECYPACREGFVCRNGQCVSPCNPPCAEGQTCTSAGQCVSGAAGSGAGEPGTPKWGEGAQGGGTQGGGQAWDPGQAPPEPLSEADKARREVRTQTRLVLYVLAGGGEDEGWKVPYGDKTVEGGLGLGFRSNFIRYFGMQARVNVLVGTLSGAIGGQGATAWASGSATALTVEGELGLRLGPVSDSVPWYFGVEGGFGARAGWGGKARCTSYQCDPSDLLEGETGMVQNGDTMDVSDYFLAPILGFESGFVFGPMEQFDLGVRLRFLSDFDGTYHAHGGLIFGWAML